MNMPTPSTVCSPKRRISGLQPGLVTSRIKAKALITMPTIRLLTWKLRANTGSTGTITPKPTETQKAIVASTYTSRGRVGSGRSRFSGEVGLGTGSG
ncbi:hypothetical protein GCM10009599_30230 [Luteococcus peritonei]